MSNTDEPTFEDKLQELDKLAELIEANEDPVEGIRLAYKFRQLTSELLD